ncbi:hypothetical protein Hdeb2414_s0653g00930061 [Helianthus debilis subsp. tardiflorus]
MQHLFFTDCFPALSLFHLFVRKVKVMVVYVLALGVAIGVLVNLEITDLRCLCLFSYLVALFVAVGVLVSMQTTNFHCLCKLLIVC